MLVRIIDNDDDRETCPGVPDSHDCF